MKQNRKQKRNLALQMVSRQETLHGGKYVFTYKAYYYKQKKSFTLRIETIAEVQKQKVDEVPCTAVDSSILRVTIIINPTCKQSIYGHSAASATKGAS